MGTKMATAKEKERGEKGFGIRARPLNPTSRSSRLSKSKWSDALMTDRTKSVVRGSNVYDDDADKTERVLLEAEFRQQLPQMEEGRTRRNFFPLLFSVSKRMSPFSSTLSPPTSGQNNLSIHRLDVDFSVRDQGMSNKLGIFSGFTNNE